MHNNFLDLELVYHLLIHSTTRYQILIRQQLAKCDCHPNPKRLHSILYKPVHPLQAQLLLQPLQILEAEELLLNVQLKPHHLPPLPRDFHPARLLLAPLPRNFHLAQLLLTLPPLKIQ